MSKILTREQIAVLYGMSADTKEVYCYGRSIKFASGAKRKRTARIIDHLKEIFCGDLK